MILHIFPNDKFAYDYIKRINSLFDKSEHFFYVFGEKFEEELNDLEFDNVRIIGWYQMMRDRTLIRLMLSSDKIIFHSLLIPGGFLALVDLLLPIIRKKCFWNIWGADLYNAYWEKKDHIVKEALRKLFIRNTYAVGYIPADYEFLKKVYRTKAKFYLASYTYEFSDISIAKDEDDCVNILIGNSATRECQYHEVIDCLSRFSDKNMKVYCVLSYPKENTAYRKEIVEYGNIKLGEKFVPLVKYMKYDEYMRILANVDIAIFNHNRQQALGNIASLLFYGKRVFINPQNGCKDYFERIGAIVYSTNDLSENIFFKGSDVEIIERNRHAILDFFSDEEFYSRWNTIFTSKFIG